MGKVKTKDLERDLYDLRVSFLDWDDQRRNKVDVVLKSLNHNSTYVDLEKTMQQMTLVAKSNEYYKQLEPAAMKMLKLHYAELSRSEQKKAADNQRRMRALQKIKQFEEQGML